MIFLSRTATVFLAAFFILFGSAAGVFSAEKLGGKVPSGPHRNRFIIAGTSLGSQTACPSLISLVRLSYFRASSSDVDPRVDMGEVLEELGEGRYVFGRFLPVGDSGSAGTKTGTTSIFTIPSDLISSASPGLIASTSPAT